MKAPELGPGFAYKMLVGQNPRYPFGDGYQPPRVLYNFFRPFLGGFSIFSRAGKEGFGGSLRKRTGTFKEKNLQEVLEVVSPLRT